MTNDEAFSMKEMYENLSRQLDVIRSEFAEYQRTTATKNELQAQIQALTRDIDRIDRQGRDDIRSIKEDVERQFKEQRDQISGKLDDQNKYIAQRFDRIEADSAANRFTLPVLLPIFVSLVSLIVAVVMALAAFM